MVELATSDLMFKNVGRTVPHKPRLVGGVKGHNINEITLPGSSGLWARSFNHSNYKTELSYISDWTLFHKLHNLIYLEKGYD